MCSSCEVIKTESTAKRPLSLTHPHLMDEWNFLRNGEVRPEYLTAGSGRKVHWYHTAEDGQVHEWEAVINSRTKRVCPTGCPYCKCQRVGYGNDLKTNFPEIAAQWHPTKNGDLRPEHVSPGSSLKVRWFHTIKGVVHEWEASISNRTRKKNPSGCPYCRNRKVGYGNDLKTSCPEIAVQWHPTKNGVLKPEHILPGSNKKVWWVCGKGHPWKTSVSHRTGRKPTNCPYCENQKVGYGNDLETNYPELCKEWDKEKNGVLLPSEVTSGSERKVYWKCREGHSWEATPMHRTCSRNPTGCPYCNRKVLIPGKDLLSKCPKLCEEWDYARNEKGPEEYFVGSNSRVYWKHLTEKGEIHRWSSVINIRARLNKPSGCPICNNGPMSNVSQEWLSSMGVLEREHYIKELKVRVDGFDPDTNTVFEFLGDYWHGNPNRFNLDDLNKHVGKTFRQLHEETLSRIDSLEGKGYKVIYIWESDFLAMQKEGVI